MLFAYSFRLLSLHFLLCHATPVASKPDKPDYVTLPTLREQTAIQDAWTKQRMSNIPNILNKYAVDAWLVRYYLSLQHNVKLVPDTPDRVAYHLLSYAYHPQTRDCEAPIIAICNMSNN